MPDPRLLLLPLQTLKQPLVIDEVHMVDDEESSWSTELLGAGAVVLVPADIRQDGATHSWLAQAVSRQLVEHWASHGHTPSLCSVITVPRGTKDEGAFMEQWCKHMEPLAPLSDVIHIYGDAGARCDLIGYKAGRFATRLRVQANKEAHFDEWLYQLAVVDTELAAAGAALGDGDGVGRKGATAQPASTAADAAQSAAAPQAPAAVPFPHLEQLVSAWHTCVSTSMCNSTWLLCQLFDRAASKLQRPHLHRYSLWSCPVSDSETCCALLLLPQAAALLNFGCYITDAFGCSCANRRSTSGTCTIQCTSTTPRPSPWELCRT